MDDNAYHKQILKELETELTHQKQFLANLKGWVNKFQTEGWSPLNPLQMLAEEGETRKASVENAIKEIKKQMK